MKFGLDKIKNIIPSKKNKEVESLDDFNDMDTNLWEDTVLDETDIETGDIQVEDIDGIELDEPSTELAEETETLLTEEQQTKQDKKLKKEAAKEAKKNIKTKKKKEFKYISQQSKLLLSNLLLIASIIFAYTIYNTSIKENLRDTEVYKKDIVTIKADNTIVESNLELLDEERDKALEYRRLNFFLDQAVPETDQYEDNLIVILRILSESVNLFSRNTKYLDSLSLKTDAKINDVETFNTETDRILGISYNMSVSGFTRFKDVKDFVNLITQRLRIFHIENLNISKVYNQNTGESEYKVGIQMYSYYKLPKLDEFGEPIEEEKESTF